MRLSDNQMRQAFEMWVESMPQEGVGDPFCQIAVPRERLETSADGIGLWREHDITTLWDTATWAVDHLRRNLTDSTARVDALQVVNVEQQQLIIAAERELTAATVDADRYHREVGLLQIDVAKRDQKIMDLSGALTAANAKLADTGLHLVEAVRLGDEARRQVEWLAKKVADSGNVCIFLLDHNIDCERYECWECMRDRSENEARKQGETK
jgi:hypothetical protein